MVHREAWHAVAAMRGVRELLVGDSLWRAFGGDVPGRQETGSSARRGTGGNLGRENGLIFHWKQGIGKRETGNGNWEMGNGSYFGQL